MSDPKTEPKSVPEVIAEIEEIASRGGYIFRGEPKCFDEVSSKLWRKYRSKDGELDIEAIQEKMLNAAKKHYSGNSDAFTILTEIQHYGGHTNLIDFTRDYRIALFFACDGDHEEPGRVVLQKEKLVKKDIRTPHSPQRRVIAQKSVFYEPPMGYIEPKDDEVVEIPAGLKKDILKHLEVCHGIHRETIYNDLHGFIISEDHHENAIMKLNRAVKCYNENKYDEAIKHYGEAIERDKHFTEAYVGRGNAYVDKGDYDMAITNYTRAIGLDPDDASIYFLRASVYYLKEDYINTIKDFDKGLSLNPTSIYAYNDCGLAYSKMDNYKKAIEYFDEAIKIDPTKYKPYVNRGDAYSRIDKYTEAIEDYGMAIELNPEEGPYIGRGFAYYIMEKYAEAIEDYGMAIELNPDDYNSYERRGFVYYKMEKYAEAIEDFNKAIALDDRTPYTHNTHIFSFRGIAYYNIGDYEKAINDFNKTIRYLPFFDEISYYDRGMSYLHLKKMDEAKADFTVANTKKINVARTFQSQHGSVAEFEQKTGLQLPDEIKKLLTPTQ